MPDITNLVKDVQASWFRTKFHLEDKKEEVTFRMDLIFKDEEALSEFLNKGSLQILSNEESDFLNKEFHDPFDGLGNKDA